MKKFLALLIILVVSMSIGVFAEDAVVTEETLPTMSEEEVRELEEKVSARKENVIFLHIGNYATVSNGILKWIDRENKAVRPYIKNDRTMVPLRFLTEEMGATVGYNEQTRGITVSLDNVMMELVVGSNIYWLNGESYEMDCAAEISDDRTFVPVRFVTEALGRCVEWYNDERMVVVTPLESPWDKVDSLSQAILSEVQLMLSPLVRDRIS